MFGACILLQERIDDERLEDEIKRCVYLVVQVGDSLIWIDNFEPIPSGV
jgi:hypothetical protein